MSKNSFHASFTDHDVREFTNTEEGFIRFLDVVSRYGYTHENVTIGTESTGVYHLPLAVYLTSRRWKVVVINPLITAQMISAGLRMVKNDRKDACVVRKAVEQGEGYVFTDTPDILALKDLAMQRTSLVQTRSDLIRRVHAHTIREQATGSVIDDHIQSIITEIDCAIKSIETEMSSYETKTQDLLQSIPGIGKVSSALLVAIIGDISRFKSKEALVAFIGLDPRVKQSGSSVNGKGFITKRGNVLLRHLLFLAARAAARYDPQLRAFAQNKKKQGKHYFVVICAVERKLIHRIFSVWSRGTPFVPKTFI